MASILSNTTNGQFLFADHATDFGAAPATAVNSLIVGTPTDVQLDLGSVAVDGSRQSAKFDFGATRPPLYRVDACIETASAASDGDAVDMWIGGSPSATAGTGNPAGLTGSDAAWTWALGAEMQLINIGSLIMQASATNIGFVGFVRPTHRYGILVVRNKGTAAFATTADEIHITLTPVEYDDAA